MDIYNDGLHRIGRIDFDSGYLYAENLSRIGCIVENGYVYDKGLRHIGQTDE